MDKLKSKGFTLIELLVVIAIISLLSSIVMASLNTARTKAIAAANQASARQLATLLALEYSDNGSYTNLVRNAWIPGISYSCNAINVSGSYATGYRDICNSVIDRLGSVSTTNNWLVGDNDNTGQEFSIMIKLTPAPTTGGQWFCLGSSGRTYTGTYNSNGPGCYYNP